MRRERFVLEQKQLHPYIHACWFFMATYPSPDQLEGVWYGYQDKETRERRFSKDVVPSWDFKIDIAALNDSKYKMDFMGRLCQRSLFQCEWMR